MNEYNDCKDRAEARGYTRRLLVALTEVLEIWLDYARRQREFDELMEEEWRLHCQQYGCETFAYQADFTNDFFFILDWS